MSILETGLRGVAVAMFALLGVLLLRDARNAPAGRYGALFAFGVACYVVASAPGLDPGGAYWLIPIRIVSLGNPALFWLFAAACFNDEFETDWRDALAWLGCAALGSWCVSAAAPALCLVYNILSLAFVALAIRHAFVGRAADLVEGRRRFRVTLIVGAGLYTTAIVATELFARGHGAAGGLGLANAAGLASIGVAVAVSRLGFRAAGQTIPLTVAADPSPAAAIAPAGRAAGGAGDAADAEETALLDRLRRLMEVDRTHREEGLSVAALAGRLGVPEYRLRRLISQHLGRRNFSAFVNGYRVAEAMAALADPGQAEVPILTIALDAGFQSIGPFNRAFKLEAGMTPTEYRRLRLGRPAAAEAGAKLAD